MAYRMRRHPSHASFDRSMIAAKDSIGPRSSDQLPNSRKIYAEGKIHPQLRVPCREISLANTHGANGTVEENARRPCVRHQRPVGRPGGRLRRARGIARVAAAVDRGTRGRGGLSRAGRCVPQDNGYLSRGHEDPPSAAAEARGRLEAFPGV